MHRRAALSLAFLALCGSCQKFAEGKEIFRELLTLRDQIATEFHEPVHDVKLANDGRMKVTFLQVPATREEKQKRADAVAAFVVAHYKHPVSSVTTEFGPADRSEAYLGRLPKNP